MPKETGKTGSLLDVSSTSIEKIPAGKGPHRLHCGAIFTGAFIHYLMEFWNANCQAHPGHILAFEYVACIEGPHAGKAWHKLLWLPSNAAAPAERFQINNTPCLISRQTQKALKDKTVDLTPKNQIQIT